MTFESEPAPPKDAAPKDAAKAADKGENGTTNGAAKKEEVTKQPALPKFSQTTVFAGVVAVASVLAVVQQSEVTQGGGFMKWGSSLFEDHVVPPPIAHDSVCTVQFCQRWGTNGLFNQIAQLIHNRADSELTVQPVNYPAPPMANLLANIVGNIQTAIMAMLFVHDKLLPETMRENKMASVFGVFLGANMISSALTKTDAFEIYVGKKLIFSQLQAGRPPNGQDLVQAFQTVGIEIDL